MRPYLDARMGEQTSASAAARDWRTVVLTGCASFAVTYALLHFVLPVDAWIASAPEPVVSMFLAAVVSILVMAATTVLLARKLRHIEATGAEILATANPGCHWQILNGARQRGLPLRVAHPVTLLAAAYRQSPPNYA